jgi:hypothetical protein
MIISRSIIFKMRNVSNQLVDKIKTPVLCSITFFYGNRAVYEIMWKHMAEPGKP